MIQTLREKIEAALVKLGFFGRILRIAANRKQAWRRRVRKTTALIEALEAELKKQLGREQRERLEAQLKQYHVRRGREHRRLIYWRKRWRWAKNRHEFWEELLASRRRRLRRLTRPDLPVWRPEMCGRHETNLTPFAKQMMAIAYTNFGLWTSSTYRPETPGSHHAENPVRGSDMAGEWNDMIAFQRFVYNTLMPYILELFGPENALCADNGSPMPLAEGSFLEDLHDSHDHHFYTESEMSAALKKVVANAL